MISSAPKPRPKPDHDEIARACTVLFGDQQIVEVRAFVPGQYGGAVTVSGYFVDRDALVKAAIEQNASGDVYVTLNDLDPALIARRSNRIERNPKATTADDNVRRRRWLLIDLDPKRPSGVSSTDAEHSSAIQRAREIRSFLVEELGWHELIFCDSGNGAHLLARIDLPNHDESRLLIQQCLQALSHMYTDNAVIVDESVFNASRVIKIYGTVAKKGDDVPDRPHRVSRLLYVPEFVQVVDEHLLRALAAHAPNALTLPHDSNGHANGRFDLDSYLQSHGVAVRQRADWRGGTKWILQRCPWCESEDKAAVVLQFPNGAIAAKCHHNRCLEKGWHDFRDSVEPGWREQRESKSNRTNNRAPAVPGRKPAPPPEPYRPLPIDALPEPARGLVTAGAKAIGCDPAMIALPLMAALASAIGATHRIQLKPTWSEPSVLWCVVVAESGSHKSPAQDMALRPLRRLQSWKFAECPALMQQYQRDLELYEADRKEWQHKGRRKGDPPPEKPVPPALPRYVVSDITIEALAEQLSHNPRGLLADCDELGALIKSFDQYRGGRGGDVQRWLTIHRAGELLIDRKTGVNKTTFVRHAAVSLAGGIQPGILRRVLGQEHFENGLAPRLLLAAPPQKVKRWSEADVHSSCLEQVERVFGRLLALPFGVDRDEIPAPVELPLSRDAKDGWVAFYNEHAVEQAALVGPLASAWSKLEGYAARFALVHHLVGWSMTDMQAPDAVSGESMRAGVILSKWFASEAIRNYSLLAESEEDRDLRQLAEWIDVRGGTTTARELQRGPRQYREPGAAEAALNQLARASYGTWDPPRSTDRGGQPTRTFRRIVATAGDRTVKNPEQGGVLSPSPMSPHEKRTALTSAEATEQDVEWLE